MFYFVLTYSLYNVYSDEQTCLFYKFIFHLFRLDICIHVYHCTCKQSKVKLNIKQCVRDYGTFSVERKSVSSTGRKKDR